jgi:hypothetical protein
VVLPSSMPFTHFVFILLPFCGYHYCFCFLDVLKGTTAFQKCNRCDMKGVKFVGECDGSVRFLNWSRLQKRTWSYFFFLLFSILLGESSSSSMYHANDLHFVFLNHCKCL